MGFINLKKKFTQITNRNSNKSDILWQKQARKLLMTSKKADLKSEADPKKNTIAEKKFSEEVAKVLEDDDDDFEEFNQEDWQDIQVDEKIDVKQWREDWDDEDIHDEFNQELRKQIGA